MRPYWETALRLISHLLSHSAARWHMQFFEEDMEKTQHHSHVDPVFEIHVNAALCRLWKFHVTV